MAAYDRDRNRQGYRDEVEDITNRKRLISNFVFIFFNLTGFVNYFPDSSNLIRVHWLTQIDSKVELIWDSRWLTKRETNFGFCPL